MSELKVKNPATPLLSTAGRRAVKEKGFHEHGVACRPCAGVKSVSLLRGQILSLARSVAMGARNDAQASFFKEAVV